jgi:N-acetylneuraminate synthase
LYVAVDVTAGAVVTPANVRSVRPAGGLPPAEIGNVVGRRFAVDTAKGTPLSWDLIS